MRAAVISILLASAVAGAGSAGAAPRYQGAMVIFASTGTCADYDPVGEQLSVRFRPGGVGDNPANTGFTFIWGNGGYGLTVPGRITSVAKTGSLTSLFDYGNTGGTATIRFTSQVPAVIQPTTASVFAIGELTDFDGMTGCTASFRMSAVKRTN